MCFHSKLHRYGDSFIVYFYFGYTLASSETVTRFHGLQDVIHGEHSRFLFSFDRHFFVVFFCLVKVVAVSAPCLLPKGESMK